MGEVRINVGAAIQEDDLSTFKRFVREGGKISTYFLTSAVKCNSKRIVEYITTNYSIDNAYKYKLLDAVCCNLGTADELRSTESVRMLLEYLSGIFYSGSRKFVFARKPVLGLNYILQVEGSFFDEQVKILNNGFMSQFTDLAKEIERFTGPNGNIQKEYLKSLIFPMERVIPDDSDEVDNSALGMLGNMDQQIIQSMQQRMQQSLKQKPQVKEVYKSMETDDDEHFGILGNVRKENDSATAYIGELEREMKDHERSLRSAEYNERTAFQYNTENNTMSRRTVGIPGSTLEERLSLAGITIDEIVEFVHRLEGRV